MAQFKAAIIAALKADSAVAAIVGTRVFPSFPPRGIALPRIVVRISTDERGHDLAGHTTQRIAQVLIYAQAATEIVAESLSAAIDAEAQTFPSTITDPVVKTSQQSEETDDFVFEGDGSSDAVFTRLVQYRIDYRI